MPIPDPIAPNAQSNAADGAAAGGARDRTSDLRFVERIHRLRTLGLGLGFFCVAAVLWLRDTPAFVWGLLFAHAIVWPHVARYLSVHSALPVRTEFRHLRIDSALGGAWIALMQFNLLPSVLLVTMLSVDKITVGGMRLVLRTTPWLVIACALTSLALGFPIDLTTPMSVIVACTPFLVGYPIAISIVAHGQSRKIIQQNRWLARLSSTDELTGLANRRQGLAAADQALARHRRHHGKAVLVVLDLDHFKAVNDRYGHPAGDEILRRVAQLLLQCCRVTDTPARLAGDEFLLVLPDTDLAGATEMTKRIRARLAAESFERAPDLACTISLGAAEARAEMADVEDWIQQADAALYRAKEGGRDRQVNAPDVVSAHGSGADGSSGASDDASPDANHRRSASG